MTGLSHEAWLKLSNEERAAFIIESLSLKFRDGMTMIAVLATTIGLGFIFYPPVVYYWNLWLKYWSF